MLNSSQSENITGERSEVSQGHFLFSYVLQFVHVTTNRMVDHSIGNFLG